MTGDKSKLTGLKSALSNVILPDGSVVKATASGTLRVAVMDDQTRRRLVIPLLDTLYVPGLTKTLWSVTQFAAEGHLVIFGIEDVTIMLNHRRQDEMHIVIPHPFYNISQAPMPFAMSSTRIAHAYMVNNQDETNGSANGSSAKKRKAKMISLDLLHKRLGHQSTQVILTAGEWNMWQDVNVQLEEDLFCYGCKIGTIQKAPHTDNPVAEDVSRPGQVLFMDIITNPFQKSVNQKTHNPYYLIIVCAYSRYATMVGMPTMTVNETLKAIQYHCVNYGPKLGSSIEMIDCIHADAGSQFTSALFKTWATDNSIKVILAAPEHQHQNGMVERW
jgi:Integrase core domain